MCTHLPRPPKMIMFNCLSDKSQQTTHSVRFASSLMMSIQRNAGWLLSFKGNMLLFLYIGKLPKLIVLLNIRDFAVATRPNKLTFLSPFFEVLLFKFRCIYAMFLFVCHCEWCELWYPKLHARWLDNSLTLANHSKTWRQVPLLHENLSGFKAVLQSRNAL